MNATLSIREQATKGVNGAERCLTDEELASAGKSRALACLEAAIAASLVPRKVLADECGMSEQYFSKVAGGKQGDFLGLVSRIRPEIRKDFAQRFAALESADPEALAAEQLAAAAIQFLKLRGVAMRMARVESTQKRKAIA